MLFALLYLVLRRLIGFAEGSKEDQSKDVEILVLRHQLKVLRRQAGRTALRLLRGSAVKTAFVWERPLRYSFSQAGGGHLYRSWFNSIFPFGLDLEMAGEDVSALKRLFSQIRTLEHQGDDTSRRFELALRRLNMAVERLADEDRLIDFWVALETLFVSDSRGEITYRARTRISRYLADEFDQRRQIARTLGESYRRRSEVVHGDRPKPDLSPLTNETGEILRRALRRMLEHSPGIDLEALDLG